MAEQVRVARQQVIDALAVYTAAPSDSAMGSLRAAVDAWEKGVEAWGNSVRPAGSVTTSSP